MQADQALDESTDRVVAVKYGVTGKFLDCRWLFGFCDCLTFDNNICWFFNNITSNRTLTIEMIPAKILVDALNKKPSAIF